jgi:hypothetical protein
MFTQMSFIVSFPHLHLCSPPYLPTQTQIQNQQDAGYMFFESKLRGKRKRSGKRSLRLKTPLPKRSKPTTQTDRLNITINRHPPHHCCQSRLPDPARPYCHWYAHASDSPEQRPAVSGGPLPWPCGTLSFQHRQPG